MSSLLRSTPVLCFTSFIIGIAICIQIDLKLDQTSFIGFVSLLLLKFGTIYSKYSMSYEAPQSIGNHITINHNLCVDQKTNFTLSCQAVAYDQLLELMIPDHKYILKNAPNTLLTVWQKMKNEDRFSIPPLGTYYEYFDIEDIPSLLIHRSPKITKKKLFSNGVIIHLHGGGYVTGSYKNDHQYMSYLHLFSGLPVLSFDYRLAPQYPLQSGALINDGNRVILNYLHKHLSVPFNKMYITGTSAGGGSVLILMHEFAKHGKYFGGVIPVSAWTDLRNLKENKNSSFITMDGIDSILNQAATELFQMYALGCRGVDGMLTENNLDLCIENGLKELNKMEMNPLTTNWNLWSDKHEKNSKKMKLLFVVSSNELLRDDSINAYNKAIDLELNAELMIIKSRTHCLPLFVDIPEALEVITKIAFKINAWNE